MPDGVIYKACGNRRATVCPSCAEVYRADAYQLVLAGLQGGKGVPDTVARHPAVFATLTAPGFGLVHTQRKTKAGRVRAVSGPPPSRALPARRGDALPPPPQGRRPAARAAVVRGLLRLRPPRRVEQPAPGNCGGAPPSRANRLLAKHAKHHGDKGRVRLSFGKVAEYQRRGVVHFHALIRLDGLDPDNPEQVVAAAAVGQRVRARPTCIRTAVEHDRVPAPSRTRPTRDGWPIAWGDQLDVRPLRVRGDEAITDTAVAGYLAKYATKGTDATGHTSKRITTDTIDIYADDSHPGRIIHAAWQLGERRRLRRTAPVGAHARLRRALLLQEQALLHHVQSAAQRTHRLPASALAANAPTCSSPTSTTRKPPSSSTHLAYVGIGWHTTGDALLANTSAAMARERRRAAREALASTA